MKRVVMCVVTMAFFLPVAPVFAQGQQETLIEESMNKLSEQGIDDDLAREMQDLPENQYYVGIGDALEIAVLSPEKLMVSTTVSPDGTITFPYIGNVGVKGLTLGEIQERIQKRLADGYMKYPVVSVVLTESRSNKFFLYGEVMKPGTYYLDDNTTVLKAISMAGGFTKFGSSSRIKVLRPKKDKAGYETIKVNIKAVMDGSSEDDLLLKSGDIVVVSEGVF